MVKLRVAVDIDIFGNLYIGELAGLLGDLI